MRSFNNSSAPQNSKFNNVKSAPDEYQRVIDAFFAGPATMRMIEVQTGVLRPNICRYVARLKRAGQIKLVRYGYCPYTRHIAGFYCTNMQLIANAERCSQLRLL
ncbi:hypothetical protein ABDD95_07760 [Mucilaginibacter sp. PAMB04274]|uniref:hypothetical protein n=1 Tax=Mucilaginibacter sp. PAMB04274 TaxID=3138568 RepID=UPI0031F6CA52